MAAPDPTTTAWVPLYNLGVAAGAPGGGGTGGPHAPTHGIVGADPVALDAAQIVSGVLVRARLPGQVAYEDENNNFTGICGFGAYVAFFGAGINSPAIVGAQPSLNFYDNTQPADKHYIRAVTFSQQFHVQGMNDAYTAGPIFFSASQFGFLVGDGTKPIYANGANLTALHAPAIATGIVAPARLGTGPANAGTFLRGDSFWAAPEGGVPSGLIAIFDGGCPGGWSRVAALDNRFPLGGGSWGATGGSTVHRHHVGLTTNPGGDHAHSFSGTVDPAGTDFFNAQPGGVTSVQLVGHRHNYGGNTGPSGTHTHGVGGDTDNVDQWPPYLTVVYCRKD